MLLGELVRREVDRYRVRRAKEGIADDRELLAALERASELRDEIAEIATALQRRLDRRTPPSDR